MERLAEQLEIVTRSWTEDVFSFQGRHYQVQDLRALPKPVQRPRPTLLVGGGAGPKSLALAARWADEFNTSSLGPDGIREVYAKLDDACLAIGRDPATMARSAMIGTLVGRTPAEVRTREAALLQAFGEPDAGDDWLEERRDRWIIGTPDEARAMVQRLADVGADRIMLQDFLPRDLDMVDLMGEALVGQL